jgi:uncharacterized protein YndB with AHSA1/START domain
MSSGGHFSLNMIINRPPPVVFAFLAEPANMTRWYEAVEQVTRSEGEPLRLGLRFEITRSLPGGVAVNIVEITELDPPRRITLESRSGPTPFRYRYTLEPTSTGTLLTLDARISAAGLAGPAAHLGPIATPLFKRGMKRNLGVLKALVESEPSDSVADMP